LILKAVQWKPHFCVLSASGARQPRAQRIKWRRNRDSSVFLLLHSGEGKKCFYCCAKIILRNCWRLLGDTEQILAGDSFHRPNLPTGKQAVAAHKRSRSDDRGNDHRTLGRHALSVVGADSADSNAVKSFPQNFKDNHVGH